MAGSDSDLILRMTRVFEATPGHGFATWTDSFDKLGNILRRAS